MGEVKGRVRPLRRLEVIEARDEGACSEGEESPSLGSQGHLLILLSPSPNHNCILT